MTVYNNKVQLSNGTVVMDISQDTVEPSKLFSGYTAHDSSGQPIEGTYVEPLPLAAYPVGSIYMSVSSTSPETLFGGTWERIEGKFLLSATDNGDSGAAQAAGNTGGEAEHTLTPSETATKSHSHTVPAHAHGLNSHKHSVGAHSHGLNSHTHTYAKPNASTVGAGGHSHTQTGKFTSGYSNGNGYKYTQGETVADGVIYTGSVDNHSHTINTTSTNSGQASGSTANSTAFDSGAASGNTANSTAVSTTDNPSDANGTAHNNMPPFLSVYVWKRTA